MDIQRREREDRDYENLCLELAEQQELEKLWVREEAEARKIQQQHDDARRFMEDTFRAKQEQAGGDHTEEADGETAEGDGRLGDNRARKE